MIMIMIRHDNINNNNENHLIIITYNSSNSNNNNDNNNDKAGPPWDLCACPQGTSDGPHREVSDVSDGITTSVRFPAA